MLAVHAGYIDVMEVLDAWHAHKIDPRTTAGASVLARLTGAVHSRSDSAGGSAGSAVGGSSPPVAAGGATSGACLKENVACLYACASVCGARVLS
jgi:hypothetical protein